MKPKEKLAETIYQTSMWLISKGLYHNYRCDEFDKYTVYLYCYIKGYEISIRIRPDITFDTVQFLISKYIYDKTGGNFNGKQYDF